MRWQVKALIQNAVSLLPSDLSYEVYYQLQRRFGTLQSVDPLEGLQAGAMTAARIVVQDRQLVGKTILEVGTGRRVNAPIAYWLAGADRVITVDLNPYLKHELIQEDLAFIRQQPDAVRALFAEGLLHEDRLAQLVDFDPGRPLTALLDLCRIDYIAPGDACAMPIDPGTVDYHTSFNVFEHIPEGVLEGILVEGRRVLRPDGLFVHKIDHSDHFSHQDDAISSINFLRYPAWQWNIAAGNRYMYMNRLRVDDFERLFARCGLTLVEVDREVDLHAKLLLDQRRLRLTSDFARRDATTVATRDSWFIASP